MLADPAVNVRAFGHEDRMGLAALLAAEVDEIWQQQFFALHGQSSARTLVAEIHGQMVGAASVLRSVIHPTGTACAIDVHPGFRRRGIGTALLQALRDTHPDAFPLRTKVITREAEQFIRKHGGRVYQVSNGETVPLRSVANLAWATAKLPPPGVKVLHANQVDGAELLQAFVSLYRWQHAAWNPVDSLPALRAALAAELDEMDWNASVVAWQDGRIVALALAFPADDGALEVVAETTVRDQLGGQEMLATTIAFLVQRASVTGFNRLVFDGHATDPHLVPVLYSIPHVEYGMPLLLMEIPE